MNWKKIGRTRIEDLQEKAIRAYFGLIVCGLLILVIVGLALALDGFRETTNKDDRTTTGLILAGIALLWIYQVLDRKKKLGQKPPQPSQSPMPDVRSMPDLTITDFEPPDPKDWASGRIEFSRGIDVTHRWIWVVVSVVVFGLFAYAFLSPHGVSEETSLGERLIQMTLLALVPMGCLVWAVVGTVGARKFGVSVFQMTDGPGRIGEQLTGVIDLAANVRPEAGLKIELIGLRQDPEGDCAVERTLVQTGTVARRTGVKHHGRLKILVAIALPPDCPPTMGAKSADCFRWVLVARAPHSGYQAEFEVPLLRAGG